MFFDSMHYGRKKVVVYKVSFSSKNNIEGFPKLSDTIFFKRYWIEKFSKDNFRRGKVFKSNF